MSETRQMLILTYVMTGIAVLEFLHHSTGFISWRTLAIVGFMVLLIQARRRSPRG